MIHNPVLDLACVRFAEQLPDKPYCSSARDCPAVVRPRSLAPRYSQVQVNPPWKIQYLLFDIDRPAGVLAWEQAGLPPPTLAVENPANGHAHLLYELATPVAAGPEARSHPLRYLRAVQRAFGVLLSADPAYNRYLVKNPLHSSWHAYSYGAPAYDLGELAEYLPPGMNLSDFAPCPEPVSRVSRIQVGSRNCDLFDHLRHHAYRHVAFARSSGHSWEHWLDLLFAHALRLSETRHSERLPIPEILSTARSVARYTWSGFDSARSRSFLARQRDRGRKSGESRRCGTVLAADRTPWATAATSRSVWYVHGGGAPCDPASAGQWEDLHSLCRVQALSGPDALRRVLFDGARPGAGRCAAARLRLSCPRYSRLTRQQILWLISALPDALSRSAIRLRGLDPMPGPNHIRYQPVPDRNAPLGAEQCGLTGASTVYQTDWVALANRSGSAPGAPCTTMALSSSSMILATT